MAYTCIKEEFADRIDPQFLANYLQVGALQISERVSKIVEIVRFTPKNTIDGKPYVSMAFKDIDGQVIYGSWFDRTPSPEVFMTMSKQKRVYAKCEFTVEIYKGNLHLHIHNCDIMSKEDVSEEIASAFSPRYKLAEQAISNIMGTSYGQYQEIFDVLAKGNMFKPLDTLFLESLGSAKLGSLSGMIDKMYVTIDQYASNPELCKLVLLYTLVLYASQAPVGTFNQNSNVTKILVRYNGHMESVKAYFKQKGNILIDSFVNETERFLLHLLKVNTPETITSLTLEDVMDYHKKLTRLGSISRIAAPGAFLQIDNKTVWNI